MKQSFGGVFVFVTSLLVQYMVIFRSASTFLKKNEKTCGKVYTKIMKKMIKHIFPEEFGKNPAYIRGLVLAFLYAGLAIAQLFSYERFSDVTLGFGLFGGRVTAVVLAVIIPALEIGALPYLLSMKLSDRWRAISCRLVVAAPVLWCLLALWQNFAGTVDRSNTGLFGGTIITTVGVWIIAFSALWLWAAVLTVRELPKRA